MAKETLTFLLSQYRSNGILKEYWLF